MGIRMKKLQLYDPLYYERKWNNGVDSWRLYFKNPKEKEKACRLYWKINGTNRFGDISPEEGELIAKFHNFLHHKYNYEIVAANRI